VKSEFSLDRFYLIFALYCLEQDAGLDALAEALNRQKNIGLSIGTEAANQSGESEESG